MEGKNRKSGHNEGEKSMKITFLGAGSTVFSKNLLGDTMLADPFHDVEIALYDIDATRLEESYVIIEAMNKTVNGGRARVTKYLGTEQRKAALRGGCFSFPANRKDLKNERGCDIMVLRTGLIILFTRN